MGPVAYGGEFVGSGLNPRLHQYRSSMFAECQIQYSCFLEFPNPLRSGLSPLVCVRTLRLRKVVICSRLQSKEVGEPELAQHLSRVRARNQQTLPPHCCAASPRHSHISTEIHLQGPSSYSRQTTSFSLWPLNTNPEPGQIPHQAEPDQRGQDSNTSRPQELCVSDNWAIARRTHRGQNAPSS